MSLSEAGRKLGLSGKLHDEWMDRFHPLGGGRFAAYGGDADMSGELAEALSEVSQPISGPTYSGVGVTVSGE